MPKSPEQIRNKIAYLEKEKRRYAATAGSFSTGLEDVALAHSLLILDVRQRELLWCLSEKPTIDA